MTLSVIAPGEHGCVNGGTEVVSSAATTFICNGTNGERGAQGLAGQAGPAGAQGPAGPAGKVQLVRCKTVKHGEKKMQQCTTKLVSGSVKFTTTGASEHATLSRHGVVFAAGMAVRMNRGSMSLRLTPLHELRPGHYTLTLVSGSGAHETIRSESFTLCWALDAMGLPPG